MEERNLYSIVHTLTDGSSYRVYCDAELNRKEIKYRTRLFDKYKTAKSYSSLSLYDSKGKLVFHREA